MQDGGVLFFEENKFLTHHHERGAYWLMLQGKLRYDKKNDKLYGTLDAYDKYTKSIFQNHDYVELQRQQKTFVAVAPTLPRYLLGGRYLPTRNINRAAADAYACLE